MTIRDHRHPKTDVVHPFLAGGCANRIHSWSKTHPEMDVGRKVKKLERDYCSLESAHCRAMTCRFSADLEALPVRVWPSTTKKWRSCSVQDGMILRGRRVVRGAALRCIAVVVPEHAAEAFTALNLADVLTDLVARINEFVVQSLMISFFMIMYGEVFQGSFQ